MQVKEVTTNSYGQEIAKLEAVFSNETNGGSLEDNSYAKATPTASLNITIDNRDAQGILKAGKYFYVDFTRCMEQSAAAS